MFVLCLPLFHVFFIWIHACMLDLGLCHVHIWFPFVNSYACIFGASLFVWLHPFPFYGLFRCNLLWEYISCILGFLMLSLLVPYNMFSFPLCMITCFVAFVLAMLALCHLVWLSLFFLHLGNFVYLFMHVTLCACFCYQALFLPTIMCRFTLVFVHEILSPFWELCLMAHMSSILQSNGTTDTKSKPTFVLLGHPFLFACLKISCSLLCMLSFFCLLVCMSLFLSLFILFVCFVLYLFLCYLFCLFASFVFSLMLHVQARSEGVTSKMQDEKGKNTSKGCKPKKGNVQ